MTEATPWIIAATQVAILVGVYLRIDHRMGALEQRVAKIEGLLEGYFGGAERA